jgi:hypothetical protein
MGDVVQLREQADLDLLHRGLVLLRNFAHSGDVELCRIEADHLHNIPTLLHEENERRHESYIRGERGLYLRRLPERGAAEYLEQVDIWYTGPWRVLARAAGVPLSDPRATAAHERWAASAAAHAVEAPPRCRAAGTAGGIRGRERDRGGGDLREVGLPGRLSVRSVGSSRSSWSCFEAEQGQARLTKHCSGPALRRAVEFRR